MQNDYSKTVAFFMIHPLHMYVYENVIEQLEKMKIECVIILNDSFHNNQKLFNMYQETVEFLNQREKKIKAMPLSQVIKNQITFNSVVSTYYFPEMLSIAQYSFKVPYGLAKIEWATDPSIIHFDKTFSYGNYEHERINIYNSNIKVGNMKFDKWFTGHLPKENDILEEIKVEEGKKILLYLPTYGDLCSIDEWAETISELKKEYTIITKVHHGTRYDPKEAHRYALVQDFSDIVLSDEYDVLKLLKIADLVFSDNSGAIFDAILADKNTVLLNIKLDINQSFNSNDDSLEQTVRKEIISVSTKDGLMNVLENDELFEKQKPIRKKINDELYEYTDGSSSERIAKVIADYVVNHHENQEKNYYKDQLVAHINQITLLNHKYARYIEQLKKENRR